MSLPSVKMWKTMASSKAPACCENKIVAPLPGPLTCTGDHQPIAGFMSMTRGGYRLCRWAQLWPRPGGSRVLLVLAAWAASMHQPSGRGKRRQRPRLHATWWPALQATQRDQSWPVRPMVVSDCAANAWGDGGRRATPVPCCIEGSHGWTPGGHWWWGAESPGRKCT